MTTTAQNVEALLRRHDYKNKGNEWIGRRFWANGDNPSAVNVKITDDEHGTFNVWTGNKESGSLYEFCELIGQPDLIAKKRVQIETTKRGYDGLDDYAIAHGVTGDVFKAAKWEQVTHYNRPALKFPTASGYRYRFIDGNEPRFAHDTGYKKCWYGLDKAIERAKETEHPLVITNGEPSVVVAHHHGLAVCCVTSGEGAIPDNLLAEFKHKYRGRVVLAFDSDATGATAAAKVSEQLKDYHISIFDNGLSDGGDLADFCKLHGDDAFIAFMQRVPDFKQPELVDMVKPQVQQLADVMAEVNKTLRTGTEAERRADLDKQLAIARAVIDRIMMGVKAPIIIDNQDLIQQAIDDQLNPERSRGLSSGLDKLDKITRGFKGGEITTFYGASGMGKSTLLSSIAYHLLNQGAGIIASTELTTLQWLYKIVAYATRVPAGVIIDKAYTSDKQKKDVLDTLKHFATTDKIKWLDARSPTTSELRAAVLDAMSQHDYKWCLIDSVTNMKPSTFTNGVQERYSEVFDDVHDLARETQIPFIVSSQVRRDVSERPQGKKRPTMTDAFGSSAIERHSAWVFSIYYHHYYVMNQQEPMDENLPEGVVEIISNKSRWSEGGQYFRAFLRGGIGFYNLKSQTISLKTG